MTIYHALVAVFALGVASCMPTPSIAPEPAASAPETSGSPPPCPTHSHATLNDTLAPEQPDYDAVVSTCVSRATPGWIDVHGLLAATAAVDVHVVATIESDPAIGWVTVGPELQAPLGWSLGTPIGGSAYALAGNHIVSIRVATGAPDALVYVLSGTWIEAEARQ